MKAVFAGILFLALLINGAQAATITSKAGAYNWNDPNAWVGGKVPGATDDVVIAANAIITIITNVSCNSLTLNGSKTTASQLIIAGTNILDVNQDVTINDGNPRTILAVGNGTLLVGRDLTIRGNNLQAELTIRLGTVDVVRNLNLPNVTDQQFITGDPNYPNQSTFTVGGSVGSKGTIKDVDINGYKTGDYFRSKNTGNWNVAGTWQASHDNVKWFNATVAPPQDARRITVVFPHVVTHQASVIHDNEIVVNGVLDCGVHIMTGAGSFSLNAGATIRTKDPNGIVLTGASGSIQHNGSRTYSPDANYTYNGTV
ncbi:MAG TPA: hypothetical protein VEV16_12710, partial [Daejeonella sp.]|nr:hypothetical protein [Daejeonella sp.]